jgi:CRISPR-associated protein Csd1
MAELAAVQKKALGDVGAGVIQRYFTAASATPGLVFGRLVRNSQHHLEKLQPGLRHVFEGRIAGIVARIGDRYPGSLDLEGQSMFALGYYQQIAENRRQQEIRKAEKESQ